MRHYSIIISVIFVACSAGSEIDFSNTREYLYNQDSSFDASRDGPTSLGDAATDAIEDALIDED